MVKMKGFSLAELMIVVAFLTILLTVLTSVLSESNKRQNTNEEEFNAPFFEALDAPVEHIRRDVRLSGEIKLIRHSDGSLWGCFFTSNNCYQVTE